MPLLLDIRTLILVLTGQLLVHTLVLLYLWRVQSQYPPARYWGGGSLIISAGLLLFGLRDLIPNGLSILLATLFLFTGWLLFCSGIIRAAGGSPPWRTGFVVMGLALAINTWFTLVAPNYPVRVLVFCLASVSFNLYTAWICLMASAGSRALTLRMIAVALIILAISSVWRAVSVFSGTVDSLLAPDFSQIQFFLIGILFFSIIAALLVLLTTQKLQDEISELARKDVLTNAFNRRALNELAVREWSRARRHSYPLSFLMLDIDFFKHYNDQNGHRAGDHALARVSVVAQETLRPEDIWCRYGGEEFVAVLPNTPGVMACNIAERLRTTIHAALEAESGMRERPFTVSIGVAELSSADNQWEDAVDAADHALYQAKSAGRNRVVFKER